MESGVIPILGTLQYNRPDLLVRLIRSIDFPVRCLLIVNTGVHGFEGQANLEAAANPHIEICKILQPGANLGCSGGWNNIMAETFYDPANPCCVICGNDIQFGPGDLKKLYDAGMSSPNVGFVFGHLMYNAFLVTRHGYERVLWFDENIWPAYCEDLDHHYRVRLSGVGWIQLPDTTMVHGEAPNWGSSTIMSDPALREQNGHTHGKNWEYMERKWRWDRQTHNAKYTHPFGDPKHPLHFWRLMPARKRQPYFRDASP